MKARPVRGIIQVHLGTGAGDLGWLVERSIRHGPPVGGDHVAARIVEVLARLAAQRDAAHGVGPASVGPVRVAVDVGGSRLGTQVPQGVVIVVQAARAAREPSRHRVGQAVQVVVGERLDDELAPGPGAPPLSHVAAGVVLVREILDPGRLQARARLDRVEPAALGLVDVLGDETVAERLSLRLRPGVQDVYAPEQAPVPAVSNLRSISVGKTSGLRTRRGTRARRRG